MSNFISAFKSIVLAILIIVAVVGFMPTRGHVKKLSIEPSKPKPILVLAQVRPVEIAKVEVIAPVAPIVAPVPTPAPVKDPNNCEPAMYWAAEPPHWCIPKPNRQVVAKQTAQTQPVRVAQTVTRPSVSGTCNDWIDQSNISDKATAKQLIGKESGCNPLAVNRSSGACGIPQALPCSKLGPVNSDGTSAVDPVTQLNWMQNYVIGRYGSWTSAMSFWHCIGQCSSKNGTINKTATWY